MWPTSLTHPRLVALGNVGTRTALFTAPVLLVIAVTLVAAENLRRLRAVAALAGRTGFARCAGPAGGRGRGPCSTSSRPLSAIRYSAAPVRRTASTSPIYGRRCCRLTRLVKPIVGDPVNPNERLFVTIESGDSTLPLMERVQTIYPRYLVAEPAAGPPGLTLRGFRNDTPYSGEELVFESLAPEHFLARCSLRGVTNTGACLLERRIGNADLTVRFPREWLSDWQNVASGIDRLIARLHPN